MKPIQRSAQSSKELAGEAFEKGKEYGEIAAEKTKEVLKSTQEMLGTQASSSDSLIEQARQTAGVAYEAAKDKAAPMIE